MAFPGVGGVVMGFLVAWVDPFLDLAPLPPPPAHRVRVEGHQLLLGVPARAVSVDLGDPSRATFPWGLGAEHRRAGTTVQHTLRGWAGLRRGWGVATVAPLAARRSVGGRRIWDLRVGARLQLRFPVAAGRLHAGGFVDAALRDPARNPVPIRAVAVAWEGPGWGVSVARRESRYGGAPVWGMAVRVGGPSAHLVVRRTPSGAHLGVGLGGDALATEAWLPVAGALPTGPGVRVGWSP